LSNIVNSPYVADFEKNYIQSLRKLVKLLRNPDIATAKDFINSVKGFDPGIIDFVMTKAPSVGVTNLELQIDKRVSNNMEGIDQGVRRDLAANIEKFLEVYDNFK